MNKKKVLLFLSDLATKLDKNGFTKGADNIDYVIKSLAKDSSEKL